MFNFLKKLKQRETTASDQWCCIVMEDATKRLVEKTDHSQMSILEISGEKWKDFNFKSYKTLCYPDIDICKDKLDETFDLIIAEQVFEHLIYPHRAAKNVYSMLNAGGYFLITTPFLILYHPAPEDCTRWTETGLKHFLEEAGFPAEHIQTGSWGNKSCTIANLDSWIVYDKRKHSLENDARFPIVVWALAKK